MILLLLVVRATSTQAADVIFPNIDVRGSAGASQTVSKGSSAVFHNPSNMIETLNPETVKNGAIEPLLDFSFAEIKYTYTHTNTRKFKPANINLLAPPATLGIGYYPIPNLSFGFALQPTGIGTTYNVAEIPIEVAGETGDYDVTFGTSGSIYNYLFGAGVSYKPTDYIALGLGIIRTEESKILKIYSPEETDPILDAAWGGNFQQFVFGIRVAPRNSNLILGTSYRNAVVKSYQGSMKHLLTNGQTVPLHASGYNPAIFGIGVEAMTYPFKVFLDYQIEYYRKGRNHVTTGYPGCAESTDLKDTHNVAGGTRYSLTPQQTVSLAVGNLPENVGDGYKVAEDSSGTQTVSNAKSIDGVTLGTIEAIPRRVFSGTYQYSLDLKEFTGHLQTALHYAYGKRTVPKGYPNEGEYSVRILIVSFATSFSF